MTAGDVGIDEYDLAERIVRNKLKIAELTEENNTIAAYWKQNDPATRVYEREGRTPIQVRVTSNNRIDDSLARKNLDPNTYLTVTKSAVDPAKARAILTAAELESITRHYDNRIEVSLL